MKSIEIKTLSHELRLFGIHQCFEGRCLEALNHNQLHDEFLQLILEDEKLHRKNRAAKMLETRARFRTQSALEDWDTSFERGITKTKIKELSHLNFLQEHRSLHIVGATGSGKTHLAISLGRRICQESKGVAFLSMNQFFEEALAAQAAGKRKHWYQKLRQIPLIIFDDFGLRRYEHHEATLFLDLLEDRYLKGSVILTSQIDPTGWPDLFEDKVVADAILDRLMHPSEKILLKGGSYREKMFKGKQKSVDPEVQNR